MRIGIVGFAGSGKSTLFDALAEGRASSGGPPGAGRIATVVHQNDARLDFLTDLYQPKKRSPISFELHDFPGVPLPGSNEGRFRAGPVRDGTEGLLLVVRGFETDAYHYPRPAADPASDARDLVCELILADLDVVTRSAEKLEESCQKPTPRQEEEKRQFALLTRVREWLEGERPVKEMELKYEERIALKGYRLLSLKPWVLLVNLGDDDPVAEAEGPFEGQIAIRTKLEAELLELPDDEREGFLEDLEMDEMRLPEFLEGLLPAMGMLRFYTAGERETHVWELRDGENAVAAAGKIHTDLARGFIRAEVVALEDLMAAGTYAGARAAGKVRLEGKDYLVKDGDVLDIRFSV